MAWVNVGNIKGDTGATGDDGDSAYIILDSAHGMIYLGDGNHEYTISLASLKGDTGPAGPVNLVSTLDATDTTNAVTNSTIASAIEDIEDDIGTITAAQNANLTLLGS